ncbi:MAG: glyoxalase [Sphingobacteriales bacterium 44-15]|nr:MAG: glyoxalase [Sphingobacteriales bacterium 44-15]
MKIRLAVALIMTFACAKSFAQQKMSPHINHVAVYVVDLQKSGDFYMNVLGLDSIPEPFHDGRHIWLRIGPGASMHIIQGAEAKKEYYKNNHFCFSVNSVDDFTALLRKKSIPYEDVAGRQMSVTTRVDGVKQIWLRDPDGYWIEINDDKDK